MSNLLSKVSSLTSGSFAHWLEDMAVAGPLVGVVSTTGCPHCKRAKGSLTSLGVAFSEAQLDDALDVLAQVKQSTGQSSVPQARPSAHVLCKPVGFGGAVCVPVQLTQAPCIPARVNDPGAQGRAVNFIAVFNLRIAGHSHRQRHMQTSVSSLH